MLKLSNSQLTRLEDLFLYNGEVGLRIPEIQKNMFLPNVASIAAGVSSPDVQGTERIYTATVRVACTTPLKHDDARATARSFQRLENTALVGSRHMLRKACTVFLPCLLASRPLPFAQTTDFPVKLLKAQDQKASVAGGGAFRGFLLQRQGYLTRMTLQFLCGLTLSSC